MTHLLYKYNFLSHGQIEISAISKADLGFIFAQADEKILTKFWGHMQIDPTGADIAAKIKACYLLKFEDVLQHNGPNKLIQSIRQNKHGPLLQKLFTAKFIDAFYRSNPKLCKQVFDDLKMKLILDEIIDKGSKGFNRGNFGIFNPSTTNLDNLKNLRSELNKPGLNLKK